MNAGLPHALLSRARSKYNEMPGRMLTRRQPARFRGLEPSTSKHLLAALAECGARSRTRDGDYVRRSAR